MGMKKSCNLCKRKVRIVALLLSSFLLSFLILTVTAQPYVSISPGEANALITSNENLVILDIRAVEAHNAEHIKDAVCEEELEDIEQHIGKEILVYDYDDTESEDFCGMLTQISFQGFRFKKIHNLEGGLKAWKEAGFQTVETRTLTPPLPSFPTSSPTSVPSQASTPVTTSTPVATTSSSSPTPTTITTSTTPTPTVPVPSSSSQTPGFEAMSTVIGILIGMVFIKTRKQSIARR
ncbi:MAG: rhodanese-like domain-containing protein [Methanosarcinales archaeon]|nr:rhodanese-like domain-containing protein [Methanosarcinales archaeon]